MHIISKITGSLTRFRSKLASWPNIPTLPGYYSALDQKDGLR